jgi:argininosuccinate synthase
MTRIVLAYAGGLETTAAIPWLTETYGAEVMTLTLDIGQGLDLAHIRERALAAGAVRAHVIDAREEFVRGYILPALYNGAFSPDRQFAGIALSRPLIAKRLVEMARMESAGAVAHGCACDGADRQRLERAVREIDPAVDIIAPLCAWGMAATEVVEYGRARNIMFTTAAVEQNVDANVWGRVIRSSIAPGDYKLTRPVSEAPATAAILNIEFDAGAPVRANGVEMPLIEMIESIETIAGTHGVGRLAGPGGSIAESPAAVVLHAAQAELLRMRQDAVASRMPGTRDDAGARHLVHGTVRVRLFKGVCEATALQSVA